MTFFYPDWSTVTDKKRIRIDANRLHQLAKSGQLTPEEKTEMRWLLTGMATRNVAWTEADEALVPEIVRHCLKKRHSFNSEKAQAFSYFTAMICNEIRSVSGQSVRYGCFDTATRTMNW